MSGGGDLYMYVPSYVGKNRLARDGRGRAQKHRGVPEVPERYLFAN